MAPSKKLIIEAKKRSQKIAYDNAERVTSEKRSPFVRKLHDHAGALFMAAMLPVLGIVAVIMQPTPDMFGMLALFALMALAQFLLTFWEVVFPPKPRSKRRGDPSMESLEKRGSRSSHYGSSIDRTYRKQDPMKSIPWAQVTFFVSGLTLIMTTALNSDNLDEPRALMTGGGFLLLTGLALRALSIWQSKRPPTDPPSGDS